MPIAVRRRSLLQGALGTGAALAASPRRARADRKKVALLATVMFKHSHAQHFIDRLLEGYGFGGEHHRPDLDLVSLYVEQVPKSDLSRERARRFPSTKIYPTIAEALTRGGPSLAVDGVLIVAEHGDYPMNARGQKLYPRRRFFQEAVKVFEASGRAVPVFNDKHLSWRWDEALATVNDARRLRFPLQAGSSLPVTHRIPAVDIPLGTRMKESVAVAYGGVDAYDIHALEAAQGMSERRAGGEVGVRRVQAMRGPAVWAWLDAPAQKTTARLAVAALSRSHTLLAPEGYTFVEPSLAWVRAKCHEVVAYSFEHRDGFRTTMLLLNDVVNDFNYAGLLADGRIVSCQTYLPMPPARATVADFFSPQLHHFEQVVASGKAVLPIERTLLTTGMTAAAVDALAEGGVKETPHLAVAYRAPVASTFWAS